MTWHERFDNLAPKKERPLCRVTTSNFPPWRREDFRCECRTGLGFCRPQLRRLQDRNLRIIAESRSPLSPRPRRGVPFTMTCPMGGPTNQPSPPIDPCVGLNRKEKSDEGKNTVSGIGTDFAPQSWRTRSSTSLTNRRRLPVSRLMRSSLA
jgi:hypothetical protein